MRRQSQRRARDNYRLEIRLHTLPNNAVTVQKGSHSTHYTKGVSQSRCTKLKIQRSKYTQFSVYFSVKNEYFKRDKATPRRTNKERKQTQAPGKSNKDDAYARATLYTIYNNLEHELVAFEINSRVSVLACVGRGSGPCSLPESVNTYAWITCQQPRSFFGLLTVPEARSSISVPNDCFFSLHKLAFVPLTQVNKRIRSRMLMLASLATRQLRQGESVHDLGEWIGRLEILQRWKHHEQRRQILKAGSSRRDPRLPTRSPSCTLPHARLPPLSPSCTFSRTRIPPLPPSCTPPHGRLPPLSPFRTPPYGRLPPLSPFRTPPIPSSSARVTLPHLSIPSSSAPVTLPHPPHTVVFRPCHPSAPPPHTVVFRPCPYRRLPPLSPFRTSPYRRLPPLSPFRTSPYRRLPPLSPFRTSPYRRLPPLSPFRTPPIRTSSAPVTLPHLSIPSSSAPVTLPHLSIPSSSAPVTFRTPPIRTSSAPVTLPHLSIPSSSAPVTLPHLSIPSSSAPVTLPHLSIPSSSAPVTFRTPPIRTSSAPVTLPPPPLSPYRTPPHARLPPQPP
ncbi:proline-rich protein 36-like [Penaeus indicus]|uniref:proline-rich protein 36-like n=1 Tax=Penaeus indicus TaxID=29960 RepID=UPI00300DA516